MQTLLFGSAYAIRLFGKSSIFKQHYTNKMSRTIARKSKMNQRIVIRGTDEDIANIKLAAQELGMDCSALIRQLLIKEKIIQPL